MWHFLVFPSHGNHLLRKFSLGKIFHIGKGFGMIISKKILRRSLNSTRKEMKGRGT
jgi:hypothetical protein